MNGGGQDIERGRGEKGMLELIEAARCGDAGLVASLLSGSGAEEMVCAVEANGATALIWAAIGGHAKCIELLLAFIPHEQVRWLVA